VRAERRYSDWTIYRRVLGEARPYWGHIGGIFALSLLSTPIALLLPVPLKIAVDNVIGNEPLTGVLDTIVPGSVSSSSTGLLIFAVALLVAVELASQLRSLFMSLLKTYTTERLTLRFRGQLFRHAQRLSLAYHDRRGTADSAYRIERDAASVPSVAVDGVIPFVAAAISFSSMMLVTAAIEPSLALIALAVAPVLGILTWSYRRRLRSRHREVKNLESRALAVIQEVLTSVRVVKAFGQEDREERRYATRAGEGMRARLRVALVDGSFWVAIGLVTSLGTGAVLFIGVKAVEAGTITLGSLLLVMGYLAQLYGPLSTMSRQVASLQSGFASAERALTLLDEEPDVVDPPNGRRLDRAAGAVEFRDVAFAYDAERPVLEGLSFRVEPGQRVGITGRTGAGKTTLASLLTRFYDPSRGQVLLDGIDIREYRLADLRNQFAIVLQEPILFSTTIAENIAYGMAGATPEQIEQAARAADVHDFIARLPEGYETPVGERGMSLSGGERQRVSLARAFLKDAPVLILDEPTSSVDVRTEAAIMAATERLMSGRTTFMIAHRLSTLEGCDLRLHLDAGRVVAPAAATSVDADEPAVPPQRR
jgi:ATP-binding cassette subfamily B protein